MAEHVCERLIGTARRECLDHCISLNERHLRTILAEGVFHYNRGRPHVSLGPGIPEPPALIVARSAGHHLPLRHRIAAKPILAGLHHEYWFEPLAGVILRSTGVRGVQGTEERTIDNALTKSTLDAIGGRAADDPEFAAEVEAELQAMCIEQGLVALRTASGLSQRQLAARMGVKQPVIAKLEADRSRNIGLQTLVRAVKAMNGHIKVSITPTEPGRAGIAERAGQKHTVVRRKSAKKR